jgi:hypothetical protein
MKFDFMKLEMSERDFRCSWSLGVWQLIRTVMLTSMQDIKEKKDFIEET